MFSFKPQYPFTQPWQMKYFGRWPRICGALLILSRKAFCLQVSLADQPRLKISPQRIIDGHALIVNCDAIGDQSQEIELQLHKAEEALGFCAMFTNQELLTKRINQYWIEKGSTQ